jgi:oxygen-independent coproporphyrinogen-3 oxidase
VGRLHTREDAIADITRLRAAGIENINLDLIAGLPHQSRESWRCSLEQLVEAHVPHASVYMLEVDEDSRLGRELLAGGSRYHAHFVPDEQLTVELYLEACEALNAAGIRQYEISNFAREGKESRHNLKYWTRQPYMGFGLDAHSMLRSQSREYDAIRWGMPDTIEAFANRENVEAGLEQTRISERQAWEEALFLGLRLNRGVDLAAVRERFGEGTEQEAREIATELQEEGLAVLEGEMLRLTAQGRLLSNEVFGRFIEEPAHTGK